MELLYQKDYETFAFFSFKHLYCIIEMADWLGQDCSSDKGVTTSNRQIRCVCNDHALKGLKY